LGYNNEFLKRYIPEENIFSEKWVQKKSRIQRDFFIHQN